MCYDGLPLCNGSKKRSPEIINPLLDLTGALPCPQINHNTNPGYGPAPSYYNAVVHCRVDDKIMDFVIRYSFRYNFPSRTGKS